MLPESFHRSSGRMSAPFQDAASNTSRMPHDRYQARLRLGDEVLASVASDGFKAEDMETPGPQQETYELLQRRQLLVDLGQAGLLIGIGQRGVGLDLVALAEQVQLADGGELCVR